MRFLMDLFRLDLNNFLLMKMTDDMAFELSGKSRNLLEQGNAGCPEQLKEWFDDWCRISFDGDVQSFHRRLSLLPAPLL